VLSRKDGKCEVFLGFKNELTTENDPELFESIVNGILPGRKIILQETINISSLADGYRHGGMVTGVPILKKNEDKQNFKLVIGCSKPLRKGVSACDHLKADF